MTTSWCGRSSVRSVVVSMARSCRMGVRHGRLWFFVDTKAQLLSLQQLRCAVESADQGSFTAAADVLEVSQPAVADQVRVLERILGVEIFRRQARGVVTTPVGEAFLAHARAALAEIA